MVKAPHPSELLAHSIATPSIVAAIMNAKYTNAMPLYRIGQEFERNGVNLSTATMSNWVIRCAERYLYPLTDRLKEVLMQQRVLHADETVVKVTKDGRPANAESRMFVYRSGEYEKQKVIVLYDYEKTRNTEIVKNYLADFSGILVTDAFSGCHSLDGKSEEILAVNCRAHARRSYADALKAMKKSGPSKASVKKSIAYQALDRIASIYALEDEWKELTPEERLSRRKEHSAPLVEAYFAWVKSIDPELKLHHKNKAGRLGMGLVVPKGFPAGL